MAFLSWTEVGNKRTFREELREWKNRNEKFWERKKNIKTIIQGLLKERTTERKENWKNELIQGVEKKKETNEVIHSGLYWKQGKKKKLKNQVILGKKRRNKIN